MARYKEIYETLKAEIRSGKFGPGNVFPSERALMRRFSVARETVRHAIGELRKQELVEPRQGTMNVLSFRARERAAGVFGMIIPDGYYEFYRRIAAGIKETARRQCGYSLLSADLDSTDQYVRLDQAVRFAEVCVREKVGGVFFQPLQMTKDSEKANRLILDILSKANIPVVLIDSDIVPPPHRSTYDLVDVDNIAIGYDLGMHILSRGARNIVFFLKPYAAPTSLLRAYGVSLAVTESGFPWRAENVVFAEPTDVAFVKALFRRRERPEAIIASNDYVAFLLLKSIREAGLKVPDDVLLAGVNGDCLATESVPQLTTMAQPCEQLGAEAVHLMRRRISEPEGSPREVSLVAKLIVRASTRRKIHRKGKRN